MAFGVLIAWLAIAPAVGGIACNINRHEARPAQGKSLSDI